MPTYVYRCNGCGNRFEDFRPMSDPDAKCPICGAKADRVISPGAGFLFRGAGFYATEYRSQEYKKRAEQDKKQGTKTNPE